MAISPARRKQLIAAGAVCSKAKRRAAVRRFHVSMLRGLMNWLRTHPDALDAPHIAPVIDDLAQLLLMRAAKRLIETGRV